LTQLRSRNVRKANGDKPLREKRGGRPRTLNG
jgi:hypothetical protein